MWSPDSVSPSWAPPAAARVRSSICSCGFTMWTAGSIAVDGCDIRQLSRKNLREQYGMVLQETWLKSATVREKYRLRKAGRHGRGDYRGSKGRPCPQLYPPPCRRGYDTVLSEDGGSLSQGQKQLLCITRVMLCLPPMLILDEATSSIDTRTELKIQNAFAKMMEGRTSFIVAHRLSTIKEADRILVMRDGRIVEQGTHESLLAKNGFYAELYNSQWAV